MSTTRMQGLSLAEEQGFLSACIILSSRYESTQRICKRIFCVEDALGINVYGHVKFESLRSTRFLSLSHREIQDIFLC